MPLQALVTAGLPCMPNCTMKFGTTRKNRDLVVEAVLDEVVEAVGASGAQSRCTSMTNGPRLVSKFTL